MAILKSNSSLSNKVIFLSASPAQEERRKDPLRSEFPRAVSSFAYSIFCAGGRIIFGGHPNITPFILKAAEAARTQYNFPLEPFIKLYQSEIFINHLITSGLRSLFSRNMTELVLTPQAHGESLYHPQQNGPSSMGRASMDLMRHRMIAGNDLSAAIFIGGQDGVRHEHALFSNFFPKKPVYFVGGCAGAAKELSLEARGSEEFRTSQDYLRLARLAVDDLKGERPS